MKKFLSMMLALVLCLSLVPSAFAAETAAVDKPADDVIARFVLDDPELVPSFKNSDEAAWESNIGYMLKHGLSELELTIEFEGYEWSEMCGTVGSSWGIRAASMIPVKNNYTAAISKYGYLGCSYELTSDPAYGSVQKRTLKIERPPADSAAMISLTKAVEVHDALWASGKITDTMTQKEKARVYYDWLIANCEYDYDALNAKNDAIAAIMGGDLSALFAMLDFGDEVVQGAPAGALVNGKDVCEGYATAYDLFMRLEGIESGVVESLSADHMWNVAMLDGTLYHIDATWGDTSGQPNKYFCMTEEAAWARFGGFEKDLEWLKALGVDVTK